MIRALQYHRSAGRYLAARAVSGTRAGGRLAGALAGNVAPLRLVDQPDPRRPGPGWARVQPTLSGICGSDLGLLTGRSSPYLGPLTSMPFVPGHEVVGHTLDELPDLPRGTRVVIDPVLGCAARGVPACPSCLGGQTSRCDHVVTGALAAGLQTGFCADTGGGWSGCLVAHTSQLHPVPDTLSDEVAVLVEPLACAVHAVRRVPVPPGARVLVVGAGTVGLLTLLALRKLTGAGEVHVIAKHGHQAERARELGATHVLDADGAARTLRRSTAALLVEPERGADYLLGGADLAFECTGGPSGLDTALRSLRAGGTVVVSGMPSGEVDLTPLWYRELQLVGAYASAAGAGGVDGPAGGRDGTQAGGRDAGRAEPQAVEADQGDFPQAIALAQAAPLDGYVDAKYPLQRWRDALDHAATAGRLGTVKVVFAPGRR